MFDIDDLKQIIDENMEERKCESERGREIVLNNARYFINWLTSSAFRPVLSEFKMYLDELFTGEMRKTLGKGIFKDLNCKQRNSLEQLLDSISRKMVVDVAQNLQNSTCDFSRQQLTNTLRVLFPSMKI